MANFEWTAFAHPPYSPDLATSDYHPSGLPQKYQPARKMLGEENTVSQWLQKMESSFYWARIRAFGQRCKRLLKVMETILENDYAFSNIVVRFWETFRFEACKQHEIKIMRH
jgi:hypothetical protein